MNREIIVPADPGDVWLSRRGVWRPTRRDGQTTASMSCPLCGVVASLSGHRIDEVNGEVSPSIVCPNAACDFHGYITLDGWEDA